MQIDLVRKWKDKIIRLPKHNILKKDDEKNEVEKKTCKRNDKKYSVMKQICKRVKEQFKCNKE